MINVFVVDDSEVARGMLIRILKGDPDVNIVGEVGTGLASIIFLEEKKPDVIMLEADISGGMKLVDVVKEIKKLAPDIKIVLCSDSKTTDLIIPASEIGVDQFISKPYVKHKVLPVIRELKKQLKV